MPVFYFDIFDGHETVADQEGTDLPGLKAAEAHATEDIHHLLCAGDELGRCRRHWEIRIRDAKGQARGTLTFWNALRPDRLTSGRVIRLDRHPSR